MEIDGGLNRTKVGLKPIEGMGDRSNPVCLNRTKVGLKRPP